MYSLLIVDDERWVRQGLRTTIDWQAEGVEVLGDAEDGEEALAFLDTQVPDIIITDIKMPRMDGLAFIEAVKARQLLCKFIIISGYSEFSYAQKAMRFGVADYVLKPIEETQVLEVVRQCIAQIQRENHEQDEIAQMSARMRESLPLARQQYVETMLLNESASNERNVKLWDQLHFRLDPNHLQVMIMKVYDWGPHAENAKDHYALRRAIGNFAKAEFAQVADVSMLTCPLDHCGDADLALLHSPASQEIGQAAMETFIKACRTYLGIGINVGMSRNCDITKLHAAFREAVQASEDALYVHERGNRNRFVELAMDFTAKHFTEPLTMNQVAEHLYLNPSYFSKLFHEKTGETFSKYLIRLRTSKAKELLKMTTLKIYEVAEQVGYQDFRHFVKLFKEQEGMTPAQYRDVGKK
ncbi:response regulator [Paenibacillus aestuarii]|uniref:Response regulator n=1 Tax=Paenibacillus aestuarii TaxID=516965 RepID=A0ABW0KHB6_9BACL|nr:response regulator [Paenibacillus aestuarii]